MAYLQDIVATQNEQLRISALNNAQTIGLSTGEAYASYFSTWETTAPQYPQPIAYTLANIGFKVNELAYACIQLNMDAISEPPIKVYDKRDDSLIDNHPLAAFMEHPTPGLTQTDFWSAVEMYLNIAGGIGWEHETANDGTLLNLWPMLQQYCSYMRGQGKLLRAIRYQPYTGMPYDDIPIERVLNFMLADPLYFGLKPQSPTTVLLKTFGFDNDMTTMI